LRYLIYSLFFKSALIASEPVQLRFHRFSND